MALSGDRLQRTLNTYDAALKDVEDATLERIYAALDAAGKELERQLTKSYAKNQGIPGLLPNQRALLIRQEISEYMALLKPEEREAIEANFERMLATGAQFGIDMSQELVNATTNTNVQSFASVPVEAIRFQAQDAAKRLYRWSDEYQQKISGIVEMHLAVGSGPQKVASTLRQELGITKGRAEAIARTEMLSSFDSATRENYKRNDIQYVQRVATVGDACGYCAARAGKVYRLDEAPGIIHPRCRCVNTAWRPEWAALGLVDNAWMEKHAADVQAQAIASGQKLNNGPAPFERANGLQPPKPVWSPGEPLPALPEKPKAVATPKPPATPKKPKAPPAFPKSLDALEVVKTLGGSTGAQLVRNPKTGQQYVMKKGANPGHLREEMAADAAYQALGVKVPKFKEYKDADGNPVKLAEFIEGKPLGDLSGQPLEAARRKLQQNFAADALLGNWDVVGLNLDNVLVDKDGEVWRIDNGGSLRYRAMGALKDDRWNNYPTEIHTLKDPSRQTGKMFGDLSHDETVSQIESLGKQRDKLLKALPKELQGDVGARLTELERFAGISRTLEADRFNQEYRERFTRHSLNLRAEGIVEKMPTRLELAEDNQLYDENQKLFDDLRGTNSRTGDLYKYLAAQGHNPMAVVEWSTQQAGDSWKDRPRALKAFLAEARDSWDEQWWKGHEGTDLSPQDYSRQQLRAARQEFDGYDEVITAQHAFTYELLNRVDIPNLNRKDGTLTLFRTESDGTVSRYGFSEGETKAYKRGGAESSSIFTPVEAVAGDNVMVMEVPIHRILGTYMQSRMGAGNSGLFLGDDENEAVFIPDGIPAKYAGKLDSALENRLKAQPTYNGPITLPLSPSLNLPPITPKNMNKAKPQPAPQFSGVKTSPLIHKLNLELIKDTMPPAAKKKYFGTTSMAKIAAMNPDDVDAAYNTYLTSP